MALFALLVQFAVSFGHVHADHAQIDPAQAVSDLAKAGPHAPDEDHADRACPICILSQMVGSAQTATPPGIPAMVLVSHPAEHSFVVLRVAVEPPASAFRSRAPPVV